MPSDPLPGINQELVRRTRRIAAVSTDAAATTELRAKLRQATVTAWAAYTAGPPVQPAAVTVDIFGAAKIPVIGGIRLVVDDTVWLISSGQGRWLCLGRIDFDGHPDWGVAWGTVVTPAAVTAPQNTIGAITDLTGLAVSWTAVAGRIYEAHVHIPVAKSALAGVVTVAVTDAANAQKASTFRTVGASAADTMVGVMPLTGILSGAITLKLRGSASAGTFNVDAGATQPGFFSIVDAGPA